MSTKVEQFIVHRILLTNDGKLSFLPRGSVFEVTEQVKQLAAQLHSTFIGKPGKGVGGFDEEQQAFASLLNAYLKGDTEYHEFTVEAGKRLLATIMAEGMVEAGFVIFSQYEYLATRFMLIAMLDTKEHVEVSQYLELSQSQHLDLSKMQIAVRINLTDYEIEADANRYISFLKGRMGRRVSDFFMQFIGCEEKLDVKQQNKQLVQQVDEYLATENLDKEEKYRHRDALLDYYKQKVDLGEEVLVSEIDEVMPKGQDETRSFSQFNQAQAQPLAPSFQADRSMLTSMKKFSGAGGGLSISFDRKMLGERVHVDLRGDSITIKGIPPNLKDQLLKSLNQDEDE